MADEDSNIKKGVIMPRQLVLKTAARIILPKTFRYGSVMHPNQRLPKSNSRCEAFLGPDVATGYRSSSRLLHEA